MPDPRGLEGVVRPDDARKNGRLGNGMGEERDLGKETSLELEEWAEQRKRAIRCRGSRDPGKRGFKG